MKAAKLEKAMVPADFVKPDNLPKDAALLQIRAKCVYEDDQLLDHVRSAMKRPIAHFGPSPQNDHEAVLVGSAPSVRDCLDEIRALKERGGYIFAIKAAHDFLIDNGIIPHLALMVDPQPHIKKCFQKKRDEIFYFVASQCHPEVFDYFKDNKVVLWHLLTGKEGEQEAINHEMALGGGSTSGMRAMTLAWAMGFRRMHLFGYDSCMINYDPEKNPVQELKIDGTLAKDGEPLKLWINERTFYCNPAMAAQCTEFEKVMNAFKGQIQVKVYGDGAIPHLARTRMNRGLSDVTETFKPIQAHKDYWTI
jgi:uncharacterized Rossmann fold enzyme